MVKSKKLDVALDLDVTKCDNVRSEVILGEAYGSITKKILNNVGFYK